MSELITQDNLSTALLKSIFDAAYMDTAIDSDGDLIVRDGIRCFLIPSKNKTRIKLMSLFRASERATHAQKLAFANRFNDDLVIVRVAVTESGNFCFDYFIPVDGGISPKAIVMATKTFVAIISQGASELDKENVLN